jgi:hypothetical protein
MAVGAAGPGSNGPGDQTPREQLGETGLPDRAMFALASKMTLTVKSPRGFKNRVWRTAHQLVLTDLNVEARFFRLCLARSWTTAPGSG